MGWLDGIANDPRIDGQGGVAGSIPQVVHLATFSPGC
jgi:hypothetical protein